MIELLKESGDVNPHDLGSGYGMLDKAWANETYIKLNLIKI